MDTPELVKTYARAAAAKRPRVVSLCALCQAPTLPSYATRRYCSNACRQRAKRQRAQALEQKTSRLTGQTLCTPADRAFWADLELE